MELGQKLRQARLDAGLSQRQLCGEEITRNMLSQIENGSARPSMDTLRYLAGRLGRPVSYFLEEEISPNAACMAAAREHYLAGKPEEALRALTDYREPDQDCDPERFLLSRLCLLSLARQAVAEQRLPYARELLHRAEQIPAVYPGGERELALLCLEAGVPHPLPELDGELLLLGEKALEAGNAPRAKALLDAVENQSGPRWTRNMGFTLYALGQFEKAAPLLEQVESADVLPALEGCFRELGDFRRAYEYACKQREG